jgi:tetratricopeptide (TPR) repeat protein
MIVRDAEETIGRAIKSALAIVDEVVVVDMGSADNTRLIVEGYGARVIEHDGADDFAAARNAGIEAAYGDWVLVLDPEEVLDSIRPVEVGRLVADDSAIAYWVRVHELDDQGQPRVGEQVRLFRNDPGARYRFPVFEEVMPALADLAESQGREFRSCRLRIRQNPAAAAAAPQRSTRDLRLLHRAIADHPEEPWFRFQLARATAVVHEDRVLPVKGFRETLDALEEAVSLVRQGSARRMHLLGYVPELFCLYANALLAADRVAEAVQVTEEAQRLAGDGPLVRYTHARALIEHAAALDDDGEVDALMTIATSHLHSLLRGDVGAGRAAISERYYGAYPEVLLGHVELTRGDSGAARERFRRAMHACPEYTGSLTGLSRIASVEGRVHDALQICMKVIAVDPHDVEAWIAGAEAQIDLGFDDNARSWLARLEQVMPEHPALESLIHRIARAGTRAQAGS